MAQMRRITVFAMLLLLIGIAAGLSLASPGQARATVVYEYVGNPFTFVNPPYTTSMFVRATLTLDTSLPDGLSLASITGLPGFSLTMTDGVRTLATSDPSIGPTQFLATTAGGSIIEWVVMTQIVDDHAISTQRVLPPTAFVTADSALNVANASLLATVSNNPGSWSAGTTPLPEPAVMDNVAGMNDTTSPRRQQPEPSIAINPRNAQIIAAGAQDFRRAMELRAACGGDRWNGLYLSADGGQSWMNSLVPGYCTDPTGGAGDEQPVSEMFGFSTNTDPVLAFDRFGNLYYSHIAFNANPFQTVPPSTSGVLFVSTYRVNDDGIATYAKTVKVPSGSGLRKTRFVAGPGIFSNFDDKQWMTVDNSPASPFSGRVYVTWTKFGAQGGQSSIWVSHCGGNGPGQEVCQDFTRGKVLNKPVAGGLVQESFPATAPDGALYVAFLQFQGGFGSTLPHSGIWLLKSTDGGDTAVQGKIADIRQIPSPIPPAGTAANDGLNSFRTGTAPGVAVTSDGTVHLVWGEWVDDTHAEVRYTRSTDGGFTWSAPISLNSDPTGHQFFPSITASGNSVHVAWYDGRLNLAGDPITDLRVFYRRSTNAGASFEAEAAVTDQPFNPNLVSRFPVFCAAFIGDYLDIDAVGDTVAVIWNDNRNVANPLSPAECQDFRTRSADPTIQSRLDGGALDQEAFVQINP